MAKKTEATVESKLRALYDLQLIDSRIDEIVSLRGELPLEVEDLENEIAGLNSRSEKIKTDIDESEKGISDQKQIIENAKELLKKYEDKLKNVRNNREYNSIVKEQEYQDLESQLAEKKIKEYKQDIPSKGGVYLDTDLIDAAIAPESKLPTGWLLRLYTTRCCRAR